jgi:hypothetical protein
MRNNSGFSYGSKLRRTQREQMSSGLPLKADLAQCSQHFAFVPKPEVFNGLAHVPLETSKARNKTWRCSKS